MRKWKYEFERDVITDVSNTELLKALLHKSNQTITLATQISVIWYFPWRYEYTMHMSTANIKPLKGRLQNTTSLTLIDYQIHKELAMGVARVSVDALWCNSLDYELVIPGHNEILESPCLEAISTSNGVWIHSFLDPEFITITSEKLKSRFAVYTCLQWLQVLMWNKN